MAQREEWGTRLGFLLAAVGSAIGLGNIWRFPYVAYDNGGGAFMIPYLFALLTAGLPLLVMEYAIGHRNRGSAPLSFARLHPKAEFVGWWQVGVSFVIASYYAVVVAWAMAYTWFSFGTQWGEDPDGFLFGTYLQVAEEPGRIGGLVPGVAVPLVLTWLVVLGVLSFGVKKGIELANKVFIPLLVVAFLVLVVRAVTLPGAAEGLTALFTPDWGALTDSGVWVDAYGQIFFSLSIGFAIMVTYASYLPRRADLTNSALIAGFGNSSFELLAGIGVFGALGFMAVSQGIGIDEVATEGIGLAFVVFPEIVNTLPALNDVFGVLFFGSLVLAGLSSLISVVQTFVAGAQEKLAIGRVPAVLGAGGAAALVSMLYATEGGLYVLDAADFFINNFGIALVGLVEVVVIAWIIRKLDLLQRHANAISDVLLGSWWKVALTVITPLLLGFVVVDKLIETGRAGYPTDDPYPWAFLLATGVAAAVGAAVIGVLLSLLRWPRGTLDDDDHEVHVADEPGSTAGSTADVPASDVSQTDETRRR
jgi:neurotransmitter:Na+ symporter, NSS family